MMNKFFSLIVCALTLYSINVGAQAYIPDQTLNNDFNSQVRSLEEFQARFNGIESKPGIKKDASSLRNNIISLFDFQIDKSKLTKEQFIKKVNCFIDSVIDNNVKFKIASAGLIVECKSKILYNGVAKNVTLYLQQEKNSKGLYRWGLVGVKGLKEAGIISDRYYTISPVEHEIHFMGLYDLINENPTHAHGYRSITRDLDELSVFLTLVQTKNIKFDSVIHQKYHCLDVPGFIFTISEKVSNGTNSGWLIDWFETYSTDDKKKYSNKLLKL